MRPPGDIRAVVIGALCEHGPLPTRDIAAFRQVGLVAARRTVDNLKRAGVVEIVGHEKRPHCKDWVALYDVVLDDEGAADVPDLPMHDAGFMLLGEVLNSWR